MCRTRWRVCSGSFFLPVAAVAAVWMPAIARHTRGAVLVALAAPHMLAARARGVGPWRLLLIHAIRDATIPRQVCSGCPWRRCSARRCRWKS